MGLTYTSIAGKSKRYYAANAALIALIVAGFAGFVISYIKGHQVFGSNNLVPWGLPIVFAIYLIGLSAGSLILSSLTYVFGREEYRPISRIAVFLAIVLIFGAMICIALDLGRPEKFWRLFMFFYLNNMTSMFAINGILYGGYFLISLAYLGIIFIGNKRWSRIMGIVAVSWAVMVHMGTGAIFGFIATREVFYSPVKPFEFLAAALESGLALLILIVFFSLKLTRRSINKGTITSLGRILLVLIGVLSLIVLVDKLTHFYSPSRAAVIYLLTGPYNMLFFAQIALGYLLPLAILLYPKTGTTVKGVLAASASAVIGIFFERYALVIPGTAYPLNYYPWHVEGLWGQVAPFPIMPVEVILSLGVVALLGLIYLLGLKFLELLPAVEKSQAGKLEAGSS
jgi:Ni/Fe-hydrogenase subunit HybB-like protein